jgi:exosortase/archaeosortase family protein
MSAVQAGRSEMATGSEVPLAASARKLGLRFALGYAAIAGVLFTVYAFPFELFGARSDWLSGYLAAYARLSGGVLGLLEPGIEVSGAVIYGRFPMTIVRNCDAIEVNILFASAVLALPVRWRPKLVALVAGLGLLVALNVLRICGLYYLGATSPAAFKVAHEEIFPLLLVAATAALFLACLRRLELGERVDVASEA